MSMITILSLRFHIMLIAECVIEARSDDAVIQEMQRFPESELLQRSCCFMIQNLVVRSPENIAIFLRNVIEKLMRKDKMNYKSYKNVATDALRDFGLDSCNL
ncbi:hypothetical protein P3S67_022918 [Capsicum chacoense]|nr:hypothetical protein FXO38_06130 [Capsicum annuum]KAF3676004.1 hypothetical protein FXO37_05538 [Capsicum annuum]